MELLGFPLMKRTWRRYETRLNAYFQMRSFGRLCLTWSNEYFLKKTYAPSGLATTDVGSRPWINCIIVRREWDDKKLFSPGSRAHSTTTMPAWNGRENEQTLLHGHTLWHENKRHRVRGRFASTLTFVLQYVVVETFHIVRVGDVGAKDATGHGERHDDRQHNRWLRR